MIKAVLFDLDGTLLPQDCDEYNRVYFEALADEMRDMGYENLENFSRDMWKVVAAIAANDGSRTNREIFLSEFSKYHGKRVYADERRFDAFYNGARYESARAKCWSDPCAAEVVRGVRALGVKVVLATNPFYPLCALVRRLNWAGLDEKDFDFITSYETFSHCKPDLGYFREVLAKLDVRPDEAVMVGNNVREDMCARKLGLHVFLVTGCLIDPDGEGADAYPHGTLPDAAAFIRSLS